MQKYQDDFSQQLRLPFHLTNSSKNDSQTEDVYSLKEKIQNVRNNLNFEIQKSEEKVKAQKQSYDIERSFGTKLELNKPDSCSESFENK